MINLSQPRRFADAAGIIHIACAIIATLFRYAGWSAVIALFSALTWANPDTTRFNDFLIFIQRGVFYQWVLVLTMLLLALRMIFFGIPCIRSVEKPGQGEIGEQTTHHSTVKRGVMSDQPVDPLIAPLVKVMNETGVFITVASCQGHRLKRMAPYVYFRAPTSAAAMLTRLIDEDLLRDAGELNYGWQIDARFNLGYELCFGLAAPHLTQGRWPWWSWRKMESDFRVLERLVQRAVTQCRQHPVPEIER